MNILKMYNDLKKINVGDYESQEKMNKILEELKIEIVTNGKINKGILSSYKKFIDRVKGRTMFEQIYKSTKDNYCLCNGFGLIDFGKDINNIPKELETKIEIYKGEYEHISIDFETTAPKENLVKKDIDLELLKKIINYNKTRKENRVIYTLENYCFDSEMLLYMLNIVGKKVEGKLEVDVVWDEYNNEIDRKAPMIFEYENKKIMLLPIKWDDNEKLEKNKNIINSL